MSPSANHLLAFINCSTLRNCLKAITGLDIPAMNHGTVLSILFARASSIAQALPGVARSDAAAGSRGLPGCAELGESEGDSRDGERIGEENERR